MAQIARLEMWGFDAHHTWSSDTYPVLDLIFKAGQVQEENALFAETQNSASNVQAKQAEVLMFKCKTVFRFSNEKSIQRTQYTDNFGESDLMNIGYQMILLISVTHVILQKPALV